MHVNANWSCATVNLDTMLTVALVEDPSRRQAATELSDLTLG